MGGGSKRVTVGHWLKAYVHLVFTRGMVDVLHELIYGERSMWKGRVTQNQDIWIDNLYLFGGDKADGGVQGAVSVLMGGATQTRHGTIAAFQGADCPAYRDVFSLWFHDFTWSFTYPQFKPVWARIENLQSGWDDGLVWYPAKLRLKRLKGILSNYSVSVVWAAPQVAAPASIAYTVQYRVVGDVSWVNLVSGSFSGGSAPSSSAVFNGVNALNAGLFNNSTAGAIPSGNTVHTHALMQDAYEFRVVKDSGSGEVAITSVVDSIPTYADINAAHFLYYVVTQKDLSIAWPKDMIDDVTWQAVADTLYTEGFGVSAFIKTSRGEELRDKILDHINGYTKFNQHTGKIELHLMRGGYDENTLTVLNNDNSELVSFNAATDTGDLVNSVIVRFKDDDENDRTITEHNLAAIQLSGGINSSVQEYEFIHNPRLARILARRDLRVLSSPLPKLSRITNRVLWNHAKGDVVKVVDDVLGINAAYRIADIQEVEEDFGKFRVELVQDVFGLSTAVYDLPDDLSQQYDPSVMQPASFFNMVEAPYWSVYSALTAAERTALPPDFGYGMAFVTRNISGAFTTGYSLLVSLDNTAYIDISDSEYTPTATLQASITETQTSFVLTGIVDMYVDNFDAVGDVLAYVGDELVSVLTYNESTRTMTVKRGVLDTVPAAHASGARVMVLTSTMARDETVRLIGDMVYYKCLPFGADNVLDENNATPDTLVFTSRASRPYPPGQFQIGGLYYPATLASAGDIVISWVGRNRLTQTVTLIGYDEANIAPEANTTYVVQFYDGATMVREVTGLTTTSFTYTEAMQLEDGDITTLTVKLFSVRDGYESWQVHSHTFEKPTLIPSVLSVVRGAATVIEGNNATFTVTLTHAYPDQLDLDFAITGNQQPADIGTLTFSNDVVQNVDGTLAVPANTASFIVTIPVLTDAIAETGETLSLMVGGVASDVINLGDV